MNQDQGAQEVEVCMEHVNHLTLKAEGVLCLRKESREGIVSWLGSLNDPLDYSSVPLMHKEIIKALPQIWLLIMHTPFFRCLA